jgi:ribosomal protein S6
MYLRKYETITLVDPTKGSDGVNKVLDRMREALTKTDAQEIRFEDWGRRKTAYTLQNYKVDRAHYLYLQYLADNTTVAELERLMKITEEAMIYQTILLEDRVVADSFDFEAAKVEETATISRGEDADAPFVVETTVVAPPEEPAAQEAVEAAPAKPAAKEAAKPAAKEAAKPAAKEAAKPAAKEPVEAAAEEVVEAAAEEVVEAAAEEPVEAAAEEVVEAAAEEPVEAAAEEVVVEAAADEAAEATTDDDAKSE